MKKIITLLALIVLYQLQSQVVVEAPGLESINAQMLQLQATSKVNSYETKLNTLQTAKSSLSTLEEIKSWNDRVATVSSAIKDYKDIEEIVNLTKRTYETGQETVKFINDNPINNEDNAISVSDKTVRQINRSLQNLSTIIGVLNSFLSTNIKMTDFERKTLIDRYKKEASKEAYNVASIRKKYEMIMAFNSF